jgi:hypothetical protein
MRGLLIEGQKRRKAWGSCTAPSREPGLLVTLYLFQPGAAPGEAGPLLHFRPFPHRLTLKEH